jgi:hypothetical protein
MNYNKENNNANGITYLSISPQRFGRIARLMDSQCKTHSAPTLAQCSTPNRNETYYCWRQKEWERIGPCHSSLLSSLSSSICCVAAAHWSWSRPLILAAIVIRAATVSSRPLAQGFPLGLGQWLEAQSFSQRDHQAIGSEGSWLQRGAH